MSASSSKQGSADGGFARYRSQWEASVLASAIAGTADISAEERAALLAAGVQGAFNGAAFGVDFDGLGGGALTWAQAGPTHWDLHFASPVGVAYVLGRVYLQPNGAWAAMVIAGVKDAQEEAMAAAEWAIARLSA
jgi:hypothetical protein